MNQLMAFVFAVDEHPPLNECFSGDKPRLFSRLEGEDKEEEPANCPQHEEMPSV